MPYIAYSALATFKKCPRRYRWKFQERRPESLSNPKYRFLGIVVQRLIERFYAEHLWMHGEEAYDVLVLSVPAVAQRVYEEERYQMSDEDRQAVEGALTPMIFRALNTIKTERLIGAINYVERDLHVAFPNGWIVRARADLVQFSRAGWVVLDGKSGRHPADPDQLRLGAIGIEADPSIAQLPYRTGFWWYQTGTIVWKKTKPSLLAKFREGVMATLARVDAGDEQPTPSPQCRYCDYRRECDAGQDWIRANTKPGSTLELPLGAVGEVSL